MTLADSFASTPAGYITGLGLPILAVMIGYGFKRFTSRLDRFESGLITVTQGLAVLVAQSTDDRAQINKVPSLETAQAVLADRMDRHEQWAREEHARIRDGRPARPTPGGNP